MFSHIVARLGAVLRGRAAGFASHSGAAAAAMIVAVMLSGCAAPPTAVVKADPANAAVPVPTVSYRSATASYRSMRPAEPAPWRPQNDAVAPQPKSDR
jgi:hypothetical protein